MKSGSPNDQKVEPNDGQICGQGLGACCAGSNDGCPPEAPICSEYGYCQCTSYKPGDPECGPGFGDSASNNKGGDTQGNGGQICGEGQGACCAGCNPGFDDIANNEIIDQDIDMLDYDITPRAGA